MCPVDFGPGSVALPSGPTLGPKKSAPWGQIGPTQPCMGGCSSCTLGPRLPSAPWSIPPPTLPAKGSDFYASQRLLLLAACFSAALPLALDPRPDHHPRSALCSRPRPSALSPSPHPFSAVRPSLTRPNRRSRLPRAATLQIPAAASEASILLPGACCGDLRVCVVCLCDLGGFTAVGPLPTGGRVCCSHCQPGFSPHPPSPRPHPRVHPSKPACPRCLLPPSLSLASQTLIVSFLFDKPNEAYTPRPGARLLTGHSQDTNRRRPP